jgi:SUN domain-containing protein 1/2
LTSSSWLNADDISASEVAIEDLQLASSPYYALQPSVSEGAGHCWPMAGSTGRLTVRLKTPIRVTAITIDHLPPSVSPVRQIRGMDNATSVDIASQHRSTSALKRFVLYGLSGESEEDEMNKMLLGSFEFDASNDAPHTQTFYLGKSIYLEGSGVEINKDFGEMEATTPIVMLHVLDNHGHPDYTCLYRFRVHGYVIPLK